MQSIRPLFFLLAFIFSPAVFAVPPAKASDAGLGKVDVVLSHAFSPAAEAELLKLVTHFNESHTATPIRLVRQSDDGKPTTLNILRRTQVAEFVAKKSLFVPLYTVMNDAGEKFDTAALSRNLLAGVTDEKGRLLALPVAYSTPVLYYNKNAFRKAKLDTEHAPATWQEVQDTAAKLQQAGFSCPYTTSWPTWVHVDNLSALSGEAVSTPKGELAFNGFAQLKHLAKLSSWKRAGLFQVFGRKNEADEQFRNGKCVMLTSESWAYTDFRDAKGVELGVAPLPHHDDAWGGRRNTLADGPSIWIGAGGKPAEYKTAAKFISFLLSPEIQVQLVSVYGHLPLTEAGRAAVLIGALHDSSQTLEVAHGEMKGAGSAMPLRISAIDPVRMILDEELEKVWADQTPPKLALDTAVARGNAILKARPTLRKSAPL